MNVEFLLWQWSLTNQFISDLVIAGFWLAFRSVSNTPEARAWTRAWIANAASLGITLVDVYWRGESEATGLGFALICGGYVAAKGAFLVWLLEGVAHARRDGSAAPVGRAPFVAVAVAALLTTVALRDLTLLSLLIQGTIGVSLAVATLRVLSGVGRPLRWLVFGMGLRALLGLAEAAAYTVDLAPLPPALTGVNELFKRLLSVSSLFDMTAEWTLALCCVLTATSRTHRELVSANDELRDAQQELRALVDVDSLTGLASRRTLPAIMRAAQPHGAALLFVDLNGFKAINDLHGHQAGDEALRRFAQALRDGFRSQDAVVRYAGDEFVVVAQGMSRVEIMARVERIEEHLRSASYQQPAIRFAAGFADFAQGSDPEEALRIADQAMYEAKARSRPMDAQ